MKFRTLRRLVRLRRLLRELAEKLRPAAVLTIWVTGFFLGRLSMSPPLALLAPTPSQTPSALAPIRIETFTPTPMPWPTQTPEPTWTTTPTEEPEPRACLSENWPPDMQQWGALIVAAAATYRLDPNLLAAQIWTESRGVAEAYGAVGEVGLMQIIPSDNPDGPSFAGRPTRAELADPVYNVNWGAARMRELLDAGDVRAALAVYQCGGRNFAQGRCESGWAYAERVLGWQARFAGACRPSTAADREIGK